MQLARGRSTSRRRLVAAVAGLGLTLIAGCTPTGPEPQPPPDGAEMTAAVDRFIDLSFAPGIRNVRAILIAVDGKTVAERYYDSDASQSAPVASVTKSVVSTLVGVAVADGDLGLHQTLRELLPSYAGVMAPRVGSITVRQLLTMTAGLPADDTAEPRPSGADWVEDIVRRGTTVPPGSRFAYSSVSSHLLAAILVRATGRPILAYAREKLFDPLGIDTRPAFQPLLHPSGADPSPEYRRAGFAWPRDPQGIHVGYGHLKMTARDMLKLGNLFLDQGRWEGEQLLSRGWVQEATSPAVATDFGFGGAHYGYQWWVTHAGDHPAFTAVGYGGQLIEVVPDLDLVVVASTWIDDTTVFDSSTWEFMVAQVIVPELTGQG